MANMYLDKAGLYEMVTAKILDLGFNPAAPNYRIDACRLAMRVCVAPKIEIINFSEIKICGILYKGAKSTTIGLNARRSPTGRNFDCMHELFHYWFHKKDEFLCRDGDPNHLEWQANEGAAQFLMPYQSFVPKYCHLHDHLYDRYPPDVAYAKQITELARSYLVGEMAVKIRIERLRGEIASFTGQGTY